MVGAHLLKKIKVVFPVGTDQVCLPNPFSYCCPHNLGATVSEVQPQYSHGLLWAARCLGGLGLLPDPVGVQEVAVKGDKLLIFLSLWPHGHLQPWQKEPGWQPVPSWEKGLTAGRDSPTSPTTLVPQGSPADGGKGLLEVLHLQASTHLLLLLFTVYLQLIIIVTDS